VSSGEEAPDQLLANPRSWRIHPKAQQDALGSVLDRVGWVSGVLVNRTTGRLVDGHLRVELALSRGEPSVPALRPRAGPSRRRRCTHPPGSSHRRRAGRHAGRPPGDDRAAATVARHQLRRTTETLMLVPIS